MTPVGGLLPPASVPAPPRLGTGPGETRQGAAAPSSPGQGPIPGAPPAPDPGQAVGNPGGTATGTVGTVQSTVGKLITPHR